MFTLAARPATVRISAPSSTTVLKEGEGAEELAARCWTLGDLGVQHVVLIARGRRLRRN
ncbi:hypothetical protein ACGFK1_25940 [Mycobacterium sp. NPDC048908]|uniref:hypothetical protein n=1 Tax=Mycobacterium sp. NPDC048908 TaxID=3364292 RepID=UPI003721BD16